MRSLSADFDLNMAALAAGKSTLAQQLAARLNLPNVLQTDIIYQVYSTHNMSVKPDIVPKTGGPSNSCISVMGSCAAAAAAGIAGGLAQPCAAVAARRPVCGRRPHGGVSSGMRYCPARHRRRPWQGARAFRFSLHVWMMWIYVDIFS